jgi:hypothetical protein
MEDGLAQEVSLWVVLAKLHARSFLSVCFVTVLRDSYMLLSSLHVCGEVGTFVLSARCRWRKRV